MASAICKDIRVESPVELDWTGDCVLVICIYAEITLRSEHIYPTSIIYKVFSKNIQRIYNGLTKDLSGIYVGE